MQITSSVKVTCMDSITGSDHAHFAYCMCRPDFTNNIIVMKQKVVSQKLPLIKPLNFKAMTYHCCVASFQ